MLSQESIDKIIEARIEMLINAPFYGNMATRLIVKEGWAGLKTAATDGRHVYFNPEWVEKLTVPQIRFVFAHEVLHNVYDHLDRRETRDHRIFNAAADYAVNGELVREKIGTPPTDIQMYHDPKYYDMNSEQIYEDLYKNAIKIDISSLGELLDEHCDWTQGSGSSEQGGGSGNDRPVLTPEQMREIRDEIREAVLNTVQTCGIGNVPGNIARMVKDLTEPKMNWRELLRQQIQSVIKSDYTFTRPNRKGWHMNAVLPGQQTAETIEIFASIDTSGSISDEQARDFLSEIKGIMQEYQDFNITVSTFDTQVYNVNKYDAYNIDEYDDYQVVGGGGTDISCVWRHLIDNNITPKKLIIFSDMYSDTFGIDGYCPTLFINHGRPGFQAPHGQTVDYS